jgi:hypothetical protein
MENSSDIPKMISNLLNRGGVVVKPPVEPLNGAHLCLANPFSPCKQTSQDRMAHPLPEPPN